MCEHLCQSCHRPNCQGKRIRFKFDLTECTGYLDTAVIDIDNIPTAGPLTNNHLASHTNLDHACDSLGPAWKGIPTAEDTAPVFDHVNPSLGELVAEINLKGIEFKRSIEKLIDQKTELRNALEDLLVIIKRMPDSNEFVGPLTDCMINHAPTFVKHNLV